jgi:thiamine-phosphate pyrophosphorylase
LAQPGTVLVLLREPDSSLRDRLALGERLRRMTIETAQLLSVRDRLDLAILLQSDGLHLGEASLCPERVRDATQDRFFLSRAIHALNELPPVGVDALLVSPVCAPRKNNPAIGFEGFEAYVRRNVTIPVYALGGMDATNAATCLNVGGAGVAAIGAVLSNDDPRGLLSALGILRAN